MLPSTTTRGANRRWPLYVLVAVALVALALVVEAFLREENFAPKKEILAPGVRDVIISSEDSLYPPPDTNRFGAPPETVFVYLSVVDLPSGEDVEASVERTGSGSALSLLSGGGAGIQVLDEQEDQLSSGGNGSTGIIKFALTTGTGEPLPPGNYTVEIQGSGETGTAARKSFVVEEA